MRVVDLSVPALGFKAHDKQVFKVLATYDGLCNCTKIYGEFLLIFVRAISMTSCFVHLFTGICWTEPNTLLPTAACPLT